MNDAWNDTVEIYKDQAGEWRWRRIASNNETLSHGESHRDRTDALRAARRANPDLPGSSAFHVDVQESR